MANINLPAYSGTIGNLTVIGTLTTNTVPSKYSHCYIDSGQNLISGSSFNLTMTQIGGMGSLLSSSTTFATPSATKYYKINAYLLVNVTSIGGGYLRLWINDSVGTLANGTSIRLYENNISTPGYTYLSASGIIRGGMNSAGTLTLGLYAHASMTGSVLQGYVTVEEFTYGAT